MPEGEEHHNHIHADGETGSHHHIDITKKVADSPADHKKIEEPAKKEEKPVKKARRWRWLIWLVGLAIILGGTGTAAAYFKWYQPIVDHYNMGTVTVKVKEGETYAMEGVAITLGDHQYVTDTNGKVTATGIVAGTYQMSVTKDGYTPVHQSLTLHRGDNDPVYVSLTKIPPKSYAVKGFVQDYISGKPVVDVQVKLGDTISKTDPSGAYGFTGVGSGDIKLLLSKDGYLSKELSLTVKDADIATAQVPLVPAGHVVFVSNRDGKRALYSTNYDGTDQKLFVTPKAGSEQFSPSFSPSGKYVLYSSTEEGQKSSYGSALAKLFVASSDGTGSKKVSDSMTVDFTPLWSPDGTKAYFSGYTSEKLDQATYQVYNPASESLSDVGEAAYGVVFSPDSQLIAYYINSSEDQPTGATNSDGSLVTTRVYYNVLKLFNPQNGDHAVLAKREQGMSGISFDTTSRSVYYEVVIDGTRHRYQVSTTGGGEQEVALSDTDSSRVYYASPDGTQKVFIDQRDGKKDVYLVDKNGGNEKRLTNLGVVVDTTTPTWTTNGQAVIFGLQREGESALYVVSIDGGDPKKITDYYSQTAYGI